MQAVCDRHETESVSESAHDLDDPSIIEEHPVRTQHELLSEKSFAEHSQNIEKPYALILTATFFNNIFTF